VGFSLMVKSGGVETGRIVQQVGERSIYTLPLTTKGGLYLGQSPMFSSAEFIVEFHIQ